VTTDYEVVVVGGGQAGLAAGYYLRRAGIPFAILDARARSGDAWRQRWDSLELFTNARYSALPGLAFPGDQGRFPRRDEVADYIESYAQTLDLPVRSNTRVTSLRSATAGYELETDEGAVTTQNVIIATGAYQRPHVPPLAEQLDAGVRQIHSAEYRNPNQLRANNAVVVVGAANSGAQVAQDLAATHSVALAVGKRLPHLPRRIFGRSLHWWGDHLGLIGASLDTWRGRTQRGDLLVGPGLRSIARRHGIRLVGRAVAANENMLVFDDGGGLETDAVVWATGYRSDYSWIDLPIFDDRGLPVHRRGVTEATGLYFLGMHNQYSRGSSLIAWVKDDASFIVDRIRAGRSSSALGE
jgi:putative flavoprotein involved in K+ transport